MNFEKVLRRFADFFEEEGLRYTLIGGLAVHAWGRSRPTRDADFAVDADAAERIRAFGEHLGFECVFESRAFANLEHSDPSWGHVDLMYLRGSTAARVFAAAVAKEIVPGRAMPVASPEHLAMMKALAMKNFPHRALYEAEDVRVLLEVPGVDREIVREYFDRHDLRELFETITRAG